MCEPMGGLGFEQLEAAELMGMSRRTFRRRSRRFGEEGEEEAFGPAARAPVGLGGPGGSRR
jgi:hypothetical protein